MMRGLTIILSVLILSTNAWGWTYIANMESYPGIGENWGCHNEAEGNGSIDSNSGTPDRPNALKAHMNEHVDNGGTAITCWNVLPSRPRQMYFQYYFKYGSNFQWHPVYNKHIYFKNSDDTSGTGPPRITFGVSGGGGQYIAVSAGIFSQPYRYPNTGQDVKIEKGVWYKVTGRVYFGTAGGSDGTLDIWINAVHTMSYTGIPMLRSGDAGINQFDIVPVWGGYVNGLSAPAGGMDQWFDRMVISTDSIDGIAGVLPLPEKIPNSPFNLKLGD